MEPELLLALKTLTSAHRLRILGVLAERPHTSEALAERLALPMRQVVREVGLLRRAGLVAFDRASTAPAHALALGRLAELGRALDAMEPSRDDPEVAPDVAGLSRDDARVIGSFFEGGRLTSIPARDSKRLVVLRHLRERCFPEDRAYPEKEVNMRLALIHPDVAALRRSLVDAGLMTRHRGAYRRAPAARHAREAAREARPPS